MVHIDSLMMEEVLKTAYEIGPLKENYHDSLGLKLLVIPCFFQEISLMRLLLLLMVTMPSSVFQQ